MRIAPRGKGFPDTGSAVTEADVAVLPHGLGELREPAMLLCGDECSGPFGLLIYQSS